MLILNHFNYKIIRDTTVVSKILMLHISKRSYPGFKQLLTFFNKLNTNNTSLISLRTLNMWKAQSNLIHRNYFLNKPSFIIQLPSHIKYNISGVVTLSPSILQKPDFKDFIYKILLKLVINIYYKDPILNKDDLAYYIKDFLNYSTIIPEEYFYLIAQHAIASVFVDYKFSYQILEKLTNYNVNYNFFENTIITSQVITEAIVFSHTLNDFVSINKNKICIIAQNPDNVHGDHAIHASKAYAIMKQPNPDFRGDFPTTNKTLFFDVKMKNDSLKTLSLVRGYLSLTNNLNPKNQELLLKRFLGDLKSVPANKNNISPLEKKIILKYCNILQQCIHNKTLNIKQKTDIFKSVHNQIDIDPDICSLVCSRIVQTPSDDYFDNIFINKIENNVNISDNAKSLDIDQLFPEGQKVDVDIWRDTIEQIINELPEGIKDRVKDNYAKYPLLEL